MKSNTHIEAFGIDYLGYKFAYKRIVLDLN